MRGEERDSSSLNENVVCKVRQTRQFQIVNKTYGFRLKLEGSKQASRKEGVGEEGRERTGPGDRHGGRDPETKTHTNPTPKPKPTPKVLICICDDDDVRVICAIGSMPAASNFTLPSLKGRA